MKSDFKQRANAYFACLVDQEHVVETFSRSMSVINLKSRLLGGPLGFTLRDELDLHRVVMEFATSCISHITTLQKMADLEKLEFPDFHYFLRFFRDFNHHNHYKPFTPSSLSISGQDKIFGFYVFTTLSQIPSLTKKYPEFFAQPRKLSLASLIEWNYLYLIGLSQRVIKEKFGDLSIKVNSGGLITELHMCQVPDDYEPL